LLLVLGVEANKDPGVGCKCAVEVVVVQREEKTVARGKENKERQHETMPIEMLSNYGRVTAGFLDESLVLEDNTRAHMRSPVSALRSVKNVAPLVPL
jgi:hypothetical protein